MAALTTQRSGNWNDTNSGTMPWTALTGSGAGGVPGSGDTVTISNTHTVTVPDGYTAVIGATGQATAYVALTVNNGGKLVLGGGASGELQLQGDLTTVTGASAIGAFTMAAGSTLRFVPSNLQRVRVFWGASCTGSIVGTSAHRCTVITDATALAAGGLAGYFGATGGAANGGLFNIQYCDFTDCGSANTTFGMCYVDLNIDGTNFTLTHCTFTRCEGINLHGNNGTNTSGSYTITYNQWTQSIGTTFSSIKTIIYVDTKNAQTGGTRLFDSNYHDLPVYWLAPGGWTITNNVIAIPTSNTTSPSQSTVNTATYGATSCDNNLYRGNLAGNQVGSVGTTTNSIVLGNGVTNPLMYLPSSAVNDICSGNVFEATNPSLNGGHLTSGIIGVSGHVQQTFRFNLLVPGQAGTGSNISCGSNTAGSTSYTYVMEHNTIFTGAGGVTYYNESGTAVVGTYASYQGNLAWTTAKAVASLHVKDLGAPTSGGIQDVLTPSTTNYNASYNLHRESPYPAGGYTNSGNGYGCNLSAAAGANDVADGDPLFVDTTRNFGTWYTSPTGANQTTTGTYAGNVDAAIAYIAGSPATTGISPGTLITACRTWIQAGFRPQNTALVGVTGTLDTAQGYTVDAAGNALGGTVGAMSLPASPDPVFPNPSVMMGMP